MASDYASVALQAGDQVAWSALFGVLQCIIFFLYKLNEIFKLKSAPQSLY